MASPKRRRLRKLTKNQQDPSALELFQKMTGLKVGGYIEPKVALGVMKKVAATPEPVAEPVVTPEPDLTEEPKASAVPEGATVSSLMDDYTRDEMEALATQVGLEDPGGYPNKTELATAILKNQE